MSDIVSGVVKLTFGLLVNKDRSKIAKRLKDGNITDEKCRRLIVRELDNIKAELDGLTREDLLSSLCCLGEGVNGLYQSLDHVKSNENPAESSEQATLVEAASSRDTGPDTINEAHALINAIASLKIRSNGSFNSAMESFKLAREKATETFCNEALSIEVRIQASQVRMMARILEKLEDPDAGVRDCRQYLTELHDIGSIQKIFSVLVDGHGGIKSWFNKTERLNNAWSVHLMNQLLFDFAMRFTKLPPKSFDWPTILLDNRSYHPVFGEYRLLRKLTESGVKVVSPYPDFTFSDKVFPRCSVVNSKKEIVATMATGDTINVFKLSGESRTFCEIPKEDHTSICVVVAMDIDAKDNLYVITMITSNKQPWIFKLFIFVENGEKRLESQLPFLHQDPGCEFKFRMAINNDGKIAILHMQNKTLYTGNISVELTSFVIDKTIHLKKISADNCRDILFLDINQTKIIASDGETVCIYAEDGKFERKVKIPEEHKDVRSVAVNRLTKRIIVITGWRKLPYNLFSFSETGELTYSLCLGSSDWLDSAVLTSHPNGAVFLVGDTGAAQFLQ